MSQAAFIQFAALLQATPGAHLCLATGASPERLYQLVTEAKTSSALNASSLRVTKLDEWCGIPLHTEGSCEDYLRRFVLDPWEVDETRYFGFDGNESDLNEVCLSIDDQLQEWGPFDAVVLGMGANGHIGMNEPDDRLRLDVHVSMLDPGSANHPMLAKAGFRPTRGITMGVGTIMSSKCVILLVAGESKREAMEQLAIRAVSTQLPASVLHLHPNAHCFVAWPDDAA